MVAPRTANYELFPLQMPKTLVPRSTMKPAMPPNVSWTISKLLRARRLLRRPKVRTASKKFLRALDGKASELRIVSAFTTFQENHSGACVILTTTRIGSSVEDPSTPMMIPAETDMSSMNEPHSQEKPVGTHTMTVMSAQFQSTRLHVKDRQNWSTGDIS
jgi:hypothetical protein